MGYVAFQYAEALFGLALEENKVSVVTSDFESFVKAQDEEIYTFLNHPKVSKKEKKDIIDKVIESSVLKHFIYVLIDNSRIDLLEESLEEFKKIVDNQNKVMNVTVYSMSKLKKAELDKLVKNLEKKHNRTVKLLNIVDKKIVGGIRIEYEGNVLDQTINHYLHNLKANLVK